jgi:hypothetical protein
MASDGEQGQPLAVGHHGLDVGRFDGSEEFVHALDEFWANKKAQPFDGLGRNKT